MKKILIKIYEGIKRLGRKLLRTFKAPPFPVNPGDKVYINVGCGLDSGKEFINIDVLTLPNIHHIHDIQDLSMLKSNSADLLYASHVVEHIPREKLDETLKEWKRVLKSGGVFRFSVPNFDNLIESYLNSGRDVDAIRDNVLGQKPPYDNHYTLWNYKKAEKVLTDLGFTKIRLWDAMNADHHDFKDRSSRMLKAGQKEILLSLNIEATKP